MSGRPPIQHTQADGLLLCGCASWRAMVDARQACLKCGKRVEDLLHAVRQLANQADYSGYDKRTIRAIELAFAMQPTEDEAT